MRFISRRLARAFMVAGMFAASGAIYGAESNACLTPMQDVAAAHYLSDTLQSKDDVCLRSFTWKPAQSPARGIVVIVHGLRDYALRYDEFAQEITRHGFAVYAQDLRGHGYSGGPRQRFDSMDQMVADAGQIVHKARQENPGVPVFMYGHSLGGLIATEYALSHADVLEGLMLSAAALKRPDSVSGLEVGVARLVAAVAPGAKVVALDDRKFSRDPAVMASLMSDPLISHQKLPAISAVATLDGIQDVQKKMGQLKQPLMVLYGTADQVNPVEGSQALFLTASGTDKTLKVYDGAYHDLMHEPEHERLTADVLEWLIIHSAKQNQAAAVPVTQ